LAERKNPRYFTGDPRGVFFILKISDLYAVTKLLAPAIIAAWRDPSGAAGRDCCRKTQQDDGSAAHQQE
jgi:hypothetical protein